ncbi:hypothetical protein TanjilG_27855 [Lupinus angustifolius]|uniref:Uncharacterized protein n=1 Tax=Lupinus angustifolius TaxID=3871 RepID=A0A4P1RHM5_LUPAN|nr:hypothetical protein TanjilG_27855 [Lupinus angustifolius]
MLNFTYVSSALDQNTTLQLPHGLPVGNSPGSKSGTTLLVQRVRICGLSSEGPIKLQNGPQLLSDFERAPLLLLRVSVRSLAIAMAGSHSQQYSPSVYILRLTFLCTFALLVCANEPSLSLDQNTTLQLPHGLPVGNSPGSKSGTTLLVQRVRICGLSRFRNLRKFAHSMKVKVLPANSNVRVPNIEICFHRNASLAVGMCPQGQWEKVSKGSWARSLSPFDNKLLDIRTAGSTLENFEVSVDEEFFAYRIIFLILGLTLMSLASFVSKSLAFYYSTAMAIGIILVILMILYQGMKLLPTGRKSSLAIFLYASAVGFGTFLLQYVPDLLRSVLTELGIGEDMYNPVCEEPTNFKINVGILGRLWMLDTMIIGGAFPIVHSVLFSFPCNHINFLISIVITLAIFLLAFVAIAGAWMGFWVVHKLILTEEGSVDISTAQFVAWAIRIVAAIMILQSSVDPLLGTLALLCGSLVSLLKRLHRLRFLRRLRRNLFKSPTKNRRSQVPDSPSFDDSLDKHMYKMQIKNDSSYLRPQSKSFTPLPCKSSERGFGRTPPKKLSEDLYPSIIHTTPERRKYSAAEWDAFTKESTEKALVELAASPDFGRWLSSNADRVSVTPNSRTDGQRRWWLLWW